MGGISLFIFKEGSRNAYNQTLSEEVFRKNYRTIFGIDVPHMDAVEDIFRVLKTDEYELLKIQLLSLLIEKKVFQKFKFLGKFHHIAIDATGVCSFSEKHCDYCLTKTSKNGVVTYFHNVLEAKLITENGFSISLCSEWISNSETNYDKQDSEHKAFNRLAIRLKSMFPRLAIVILADGLYPNNTFFEICRSNNWNYIVTFKDGNLKSVWEEINLLPNTAKGRFEKSIAKSKQMIYQNYSFLNGLEYQDFKVNWVECKEVIKDTKGDKISENRFVFLSNMSITTQNIVEVVCSGRLRWKIENEGFNIQKNSNYQLQHKYSRVSYNAMQNWYNSLQIAAMIVDLTLLSDSFQEIFKQKKQTVKHLWKCLWSLLNICYIDTSDIYNNYKRTQVRFGH